MTTQLQNYHDRLETMVIKDSNQNIIHFNDKFTKGSRLF
jgi:hypothetical protein